MIWLVTGMSLVTLLIFPEQCRTGGTNGVFLCIQVLIPSLFPFMVLSSFIVCSGLSSKVPSWAGSLTQVIFGLPKDSFAVIILSLIGGYPVGAKGINSLYKEGRISAKQAERMAMFCVASGPGFLVTYTGCSMLGSKQTGYILLVSQVLTFIALGVIARFAVQKEVESEEKVNGNIHKRTGNALVVSVSEAIRACGFMCALVVLFGAVCEIYLYITEGVPTLRFITAVLEITNGIKFLAEGYSVVLISAMCGFGGICVHFQIFTMLGEIRISKVKFYIFRVAGGLLNALFTCILLRIFPQTQGVFSTVNKTQPAFNKGITGCVFLIICCVVFLASIKSANIKPRKSR